MAPASRTEPMKHITLHNFLKQQHLLQQRLKPAAVLWSWPVPRPPHDESAVPDDADGASWPPRSYTCAFCRREFRSAQALGGHMNVHRRDRAKLRGQYGAAPPAAEAASEPAPVATTEYAVLYPVLNSNAAGERAVFIPSGDMLLSTSVALDASAAHGHRFHIGNDDENDKDIDLELRLGWP